MIKALIRCADCNQVFPDYKGYEVVRGSIPGVEWSDADLVRGRRDFSSDESGRHWIDRRFTRLFPDT